MQDALASHFTRAEAVGFLGPKLSKEELVALLVGHSHPGAVHAAAVSSAPHLMPALVPTSVTAGCVFCIFIIFIF
jgi:hypothetical protein